MSSKCTKCKGDFTDDAIQLPKGKGNFEVHPDGFICGGCGNANHWTCLQYNMSVVTKCILPVLNFCKTGWLCGDCADRKEIMGLKLAGLTNLEIVTQPSQQLDKLQQLQNSIDEIKNLVTINTGMYDIRTPGQETSNNTMAGVTDNTFEATMEMLHEHERREKNKINCIFKNIQEIKDSSWENRKNMIYNR